MAQIRQFADTSSVSLAYAIDSAPDSTGLSATEFNYVPFTSEGFQLAKDSQMSTAITSDRRHSGSKNTKGNATGSASLEFGYTPFCLDMLQLAMMSSWEEGEVGEEYLIDGEDMQFFLVEKRVRNMVDGQRKNFFERYYGTLVNEATIEIGSSDLISMSINTISVFGDTNSANSTEMEPEAGGLVSQYNSPSSYEIADASNNIKNVVIKDAQGDPMEVTFSDVTLSISNNVREQVGIGHEFAAGMAMGKVNVQVSGTIYYYDDTVLKAHLQNSYVSVEMTMETSDGEFTFILPAGKAEAPNANAQGENQDYSQSLTINGERGTVMIGGEEKTCVMAILKSAA